MTNKTKLVVGISLALFTGSAMAASTQAEEDSLLVMFKESVSKEQREEVIRGVGGILRETDVLGRDLRMRHVAQGRINEIRVANSAQRDRAIKRLAAHPLIEVAEPNYTISINDIQAQAVPNDPNFGNLWGLHNTGQAGGTPDADISAVEAWDITTGSSDIVIGVIDSGVDYTHPDLAANMWQNPGEICDNGIDDTGTGVIDDCFGYSAIDDDGDPMDENGHGTHVAGTIGAVGDNNLGVVGVNWNVKVAGCQFLDADGFGSTAGAIACIDYFTNLKVNHGVNLLATNNSWGGGPYSETLRTAISDGIDAGILFVAASGNEASDSDAIPAYPAAYDLDGIISVANTDRNDELAVLSNYGLTSVDLGAPGSAILSTYLNDGYATASGTSMASPHVAGTAALIWSIAPHLDLFEVKQILLDSGDPIPALAGRTVTGNRLNAYQALLDADPTPGFALIMQPAAQEVSAGDSAEYTIEVLSIADWSGEVDLSASIDPALDFDLSADTAFAGEEVTLTVYTDEDTQWGEYDINLTASDVDTGELTGSAASSLMVLPANLVDFPYENNNPVSIPDADPEGITSVISVAEEGLVFGTDVSVNITHTWIGDLIITLTSPDGTEHVLHDRDGGSAEDIDQTWSVDAFNGESMQGDWTLFVSDNAAADTGTLNFWSLVISAASDEEPQPDAPSADFSYSIDGMTVNFTDESEADLDLVSHEWDFGDGASSTEENPMHTYAEQGSYDVSLVVTDSDDQSDSVTKTITINLDQIEVSVASARKLRTGLAVVQLRWDNADGEVVVYRDGELVGTYTGNRLRDSFMTDADEVTYEVCPADGPADKCGEVTHQF
ncbi:peptidase S8 [Aliidiomarina sedimenti]|uniref:Peptidase S8 n=2 Tax=Aliidiomarina sedimenti TaxID=1933879 RepID=A0ABY0C0P9_9GAMM|nr:peptidase S8 [Aliidiomarina sedimenti]